MCNIFLFSQDLMAKRAQDKTSYKRMNAMITRTKGYSKSVVEDAKVWVTSFITKFVDHLIFREILPHF